MQIFILDLRIQNFRNFIMTEVRERCLELLGEQYYFNHKMKLSVSMNMIRCSIQISPVFQNSIFQKIYYG